MGAEGDLEVGAADPSVEGTSVGCSVGAEDNLLGELLADTVGRSDGKPLGGLLGASDGKALWELVGVTLGRLDANSVVGEAVVGAAVVWPGGGCVVSGGTEERRHVFLVLQYKEQQFSKVEHAPPLGTH